MKRHFFIFLSILLFIFLIVAALIARALYRFQATSPQATPNLTTSQDQRYTNAVYMYSFTHDNSVRVQEFSPEYISLFPNNSDQALPLVDIQAFQIASLQYEYTTLGTKDLQPLLDLCNSQTSSLKTYCEVLSQDIVTIQGKQVLSILLSENTVNNKGIKQLKRTLPPLHVLFSPPSNQPFILSIHGSFDNPEDSTQLVSKLLSSLTFISDSSSVSSEGETTDAMEMLTKYLERITMSEGSTHSVCSYEVITDNRTKGGNGNLDTIVLCRRYQEQENVVHLRTEIFAPIQIRFAQGEKEGLIQSHYPDTISDQSQRALSTFSQELQEIAKNLDAPTQQLRKQRLQSEVDERARKIFGEKTIE